MFNYQYIEYRNNTIGQIYLSEKKIFVLIYNSITSNNGCVFFDFKISFFLSLIAFLLISIDLKKIPEFFELGNLLEIKIENKNLNYILTLDKKNVILYYFFIFFFILAILQLLYLSGFINFFSWLFMAYYISAWTLMFILKIIYINLKKKKSKEKIEKNVIGFIPSDLSDLKANKNIDNLIINKNIKKNNILNFFKKKIERNHLRSAFEFSFVSSMVDFLTDLRAVFIERLKNYDPSWNQKKFEAVSKSDMSLTLFFWKLYLSIFFFKFLIFFFKKI